MTGKQAQRKTDLPLRRRLIIAGSSGLAVLATAVLMASLWGLWLFTAPGPAAPDGKLTTVLLRHGAGLAEIASSLEDGGAIRSASVFAAAAQISGAARQLKAGEYAFPDHASIRDVLETVRNGRIVRHLVTIPEGVTADAAVDILMSNPVLQGSVPAPPEGSILPETYDVVRGEERAVVLKRMMDARDRVLRDLWAKRRAGLPLKTPDEAVTLASIVEKETALPAERPRIAAVFVNRLKQGIRLESDPTVIYGLTRGKPLGRGLLRSELDRPNPFSTYQIAGLPPTAIANPGRASLAAVLDPPETQELFFVADGSGGHVFARTYEEHLQNVEKWRKVEQDRRDRQNALRGGPAAPPSAAPPAAAR